MARTVAAKALSRAGGARAGGGGAPAPASGGRRARRPGRIESASAPDKSRPDMALASRLSLTP